MAHLFDVTVRGVALLDYGLTETQTVEGVGLLTNGLIWPCASIWYGPIMSTGATAVMSTWSLTTGDVLTNWVFIGPSVATGWTAQSTNKIEEC